MDDSSCLRFFLEPDDTLHRRYEALRAYFVQRRPLQEIATQRAREVETIARHLEISLGELIHRANMSLAELENRRIEGENIPGLEGNIAQAE